MFFFNDTATTEIYTLSLHDALPIFTLHTAAAPLIFKTTKEVKGSEFVELATVETKIRSEEHTSELQSRQYLVCRLLLEKKNMKRACHRFRCALASGGSDDEITDMLR